MLVRGHLVDPPLLNELFQEIGPFVLEEVGAGQGAVAPDDDQIGDAPVQQVLGSLQTAFSFTKIFASK